MKTPSSIPSASRTRRGRATTLAGASLFLAALLGSGVARSEESSPLPLALSGHDPIELIAGKEVAGDSTVSTVHEGHVYRFVDRAHLERFASDPERYGIQFGGACTKMGPLAGQGSPDRWHVHEGRIYIFASESCRQSFRDAPDDYIDRLDAPPSGTEAERAEAARLLAKAVEAMGGREALAKLESVETRRRHEFAGKERTYTWATRERLEFPGRCRYVEEYDGNEAGWTLGPRAEECTLYSGSEVIPAAPSVRRYMVQVFHRNPVALLKAWLAGDATAAAAGSAEVRGTPVTNVAVGAAGATTILGIARDGRILRAAYRGRVTKGISDVVVEYDGFRDVDGYSMPHDAVIYADGARLENPKSGIESIRVAAGTAPR